VVSGSRGGIAGVLACLGVVSSASCAQVSGLDRLSKVQCVDSCDGGETAPDATLQDTGADTGSVDTGIDIGAVGSDDGSGNADTLDAPENGDESSMSDASDAGLDVATGDAMDSAVADAMDSAVADAGRDAPSDAAREATACTPITTGLLAHWTMDASSVNGTTLVDSSGNHNDGTLVGFTSPVTVPGRIGGALSFPPSSGGYVAMPTTIAINGAAGGINSVSIWFYRSGTNISDTLIDLPNSPRYDLWLTGGTGNILCINTANSDCFGVQDNSLAGRWVHAVAMFSNGATVQGSIYIDGQNRNAKCLDGIINGPDGGAFGACSFTRNAAPPVTLGGDTGFYFHGLLDDVRIYNRALTAAEVNALYYGYACP
jgi:hypothetical protein